MDGIADVIGPCSFCRGMMPPFGMPFGMPFGFPGMPFVPMVPVPMAVQPMPPPHMGGRGYGGRGPRPPMGDHLGGRGMGEWPVRRNTWGVIRGS